MEKNRSRHVIADHFIRKKETICHIFVIWDTEVNDTLHTVNKAYWKCNHKILMVVNCNKTSSIENRWHSCDELLMCGDKPFCQYNEF